jgi:hypothetical protein
MESIAELWRENTVIVLYDLRESFEQARTDREGWGRENTSVYPLGLDHVVVAFHPGGAVEVAA